jgi:hypothetical protein
MQSDLWRELAIIASQPLGWLLPLVGMTLLAIVGLVIWEACCQALVRFAAAFRLHRKQARTDSNVVEFTRRQQLDSLVEAPLSAIRRKQ